MAVAANASNVEGSPAQVFGAEIAFGVSFTLAAALLVATTIGTKRTRKAAKA